MTSENACAAIFLPTMQAAADATHASLGEGAALGEHLYRAPALATNGRTAKALPYGGNFMRRRRMRTAKAPSRAWAWVRRILRPPALPRVEQFPSLPPITPEWRPEYSPVPLLLSGPVTNIQASGGTIHCSPLQKPAERLCISWLILMLHYRRKTGHSAFGEGGRRGIH